MTEVCVFQIILYLVVLLALVKPLGWYMAKVYEGKPWGLTPICQPCERLIYKLCGVNPAQEMNWKTYLFSMLFFNLLGLLIVYFILRLQFYFPLNPQNFST